MASPTRRAGDNIIKLFFFFLIDTPAKLTGFARHYQAFSAKSNMCSTQIGL
jgi:hypothetical protein